MPGRKFNSNAYKYGFNGKENDNEVVGTGRGTQDYGMRIYNPALGRFLSVDPLQKEFAWNSSYAFAENDVIRAIDLDGAEKNFVFYFEFKGTRLRHVVPYSVIHPGVKNGPLGTGDYVRTQDPKTKQFTGGYVKSYEDENPIRAALQDIDRSYQGKKGFYKKGLPTLIAISGVVTLGASLAVTSAAVAAGSAVSVGEASLLTVDAISTANDVDAAASVDGQGFLSAIPGLEATLSVVSFLGGGKSLINDITSIPDPNIVKKSGDVIEKTIKEEKVLTGTAGMVADEVDALYNTSPTIMDEDDLKENY